MAEVGLLALLLLPVGLLLIWLGRRGSTEAANPNPVGRSMLTSGVGFLVAVAVMVAARAFGVDSDVAVGLAMGIVVAAVAYLAFSAVRSAGRK